MGGDRGAADGDGEQEDADRTMEMGHDGRSTLGHGGILRIRTGLPRGWIAAAPRQSMGIVHGSNRFFGDAGVG
jgi:hypothetical protein